MWCPVHNAGGETTAHSAMRAMVRRGHDVTVICKPQSEGEGEKFTDYEFEGVKIIKVSIDRAQSICRDLIPQLNPDLLITHLDLTTLAMQLSIDLKLPLAHWVHNTMSFKVFRVIPEKCQLAIFNSQWVAEDHQWFDIADGVKTIRPQIVIHPTVEPDRYRCERGAKITLVNPTPGKGADTFYQLSKALPQYEFLTVKSVYGEQIAVPNIEAHIHPNVETMEHTPDIREVFRKTKILLMPSDYESYGRVAVEAACSGIPTIAHPTPGLKECLGDAGIFHERITPVLCTSGPMTRKMVNEQNEKNLEAWKSEIVRLMTDEVYYRKRSDAVLALASKLNPEAEYDRLEDALLVTAVDFSRHKEELQSKMWTADRRIYRKMDGTLTDEMTPAAISLYCAVGHPMPLEEAIKYGFTSAPSVTVTPDLDTSEIVSKMVEGPAENKAVEEPKRRGRPRKVA